MSDWQESTLEDLCDDITVGFVGTMANEYQPFGVPFFRSLNIEPYKINEDDLKFISTEFHKRIKKSALSPGDIVIVRTGKPGACALVPENFPVANCSDLVVVRSKPTINKRFLCYYINSEASHHVHSHLVGAVQQHFNIGSARTLLVRYPVRKEQDAIANVLGSIDDKIELLRQMNETLQAVARALFKSWFVDFDPVRKKDGGLPTGLPKEIEDLFPSEFENSEQGDIPKGWKVETVSDCASLISMGLAPVYIEEGGVMVLNQKCVRNHEVDFSKARRHDDSAKKIGEKEVQVHDVLINSTGEGTLGRVAQVLSLRERTTVDAHVMIVRPKELDWVLYLGENLVRREVEIESMAEGSTGQTGLSRVRVGLLPVVVPPGEILKAFNGMVGNVVKEREATRTQILTLSCLRDSLLPKLISGDLELTDEMITQILEPAR